MNSQKLNFYTNLFLPLRGVSLFFFLLIIVLCHFIFLNYDIIHTIACATAIYDGHILNFYDYNLALHSYVNYMPATYILFAIWGLPLKLMGVLNTPDDAQNVWIWFKVLTLIFTVGSATQLFKIGMLLQFTEEKSRRMTIFWLTSPIFIYSQFIVSQYDIITIFFFLMGFRFFLLGQINRFLVAVAIACSFKYYPFLIFLPVILFYQKNVFKLLGQILAMISLVLIQVSIFDQSQAFQQHVLGFGVLQSVFDSKFSIGKTMVSVIPFLYVILCGFAYFMRIELLDKLQIQKLTIYFMFCSMAILFVFNVWYPHWPVYLTPLCALLAFKSRREDFFSVLDLVMMYGFIGFIVHFYPYNGDQNLLIYGALSSFKPLLADQSQVFNMANTIFFKNLKSEAMFGIWAGCIFLYAILCHPNRHISDTDQQVSYQTKDLDFLFKLRLFLGISIFLIPVAISFIKTPA
jgi:hypothetical protein